MKTVAILIFLAGMIFPAQLAAAEQAEASPRIVFESIEHDFGEVTPGSVNVWRVTFFNRGNATLEIKDIRTTCGCTAVAPQKMVLQPGESSILEVKFRAGVHGGPALKQISVMTNDPQNSPALLDIRAFVAADVEFSPSSLRFTDVLPDESRSESLFLTPKDPKTFKIDSVLVSVPFLKWDTEQLPDGRIRLKVILIPGMADAGNKTFVNTLVQIKTNSEKYPLLKIPVLIKFQQPYSVVPVRLRIFGKVGSANLFRDIFVKSNTAQPFHITTVSCNIAGVSVAIHSNGNTGNTLRVTVDPSMPEGLQNGVITITLPDKVLNVPVMVRLTS